MPYFSFFLLIVFFDPFRYSPSFCYLTPPLFFFFFPSSFLSSFFLFPLLLLYAFPYSSSFHTLSLPRSLCLLSFLYTYSFHPVPVYVFFSLPFILSESDTVYVSLFFVMVCMMIPWYHAAFLYFLFCFLLVLSVQLLSTFACCPTWKTII
jgi:hypothetical protein